MPFPQGGPSGSFYIGRCPLALSISQFLYNVHFFLYTATTVCVCVSVSVNVCPLSTSSLFFSHSQMTVSFMREGVMSTLPTNTYQVPIHFRALYTVSAQ